jgi:predicted acyl esterase
MSEDPNSEEEWPPPEARRQGAIWRAEGHLERQEYAAAASALEGLHDPEARGLHHLAAAGYKLQEGDLESARRQLAHARRRLGDHPLVRALESAHRELAQP